MPGDPGYFLMAFLKKEHILFRTILLEVSEYFIYLLTQVILCSQFTSNSILTNFHRLTEKILNKRKG